MSNMNIEDFVNSVFKAGFAIVILKYVMKTLIWLVAIAFFLYLFITA